VAKIDLAALWAFGAWRTERNCKPFSQRGINNHNAALNRVQDEAELNGWIVKAMRPTLLGKGVKLPGQETSYNVFISYSYMPFLILFIRIGSRLKSPRS
jgi:hypothetical protein